MPIAFNHLVLLFNQPPWLSSANADRNPDKVCVHLVKQPQPSSARTTHVGHLRTQAHKHRIKYQHTPQAFEARLHHLFVLLMNNLVADFLAVTVVRIGADEYRSPLSGAE
jgi:hypothetical protein